MERDELLFLVIAIIVGGLLGWLLALAV